MHDIKLTEKQYYELIRFHKTIRDKRLAYRINAIILLHKGYSYSEIENVLLLDKKTIQRYKKTYLEKGIDGLLDLHYKGSKRELREEELKELEEHLEDNLYSTAGEISKYIEKRFNKKYTAEGLVPLLKKLGFVYKKIKLEPGKYDRKEQELFVKAYKKGRKRLKKDEKIYFMDAVHPTHNVMASYGWIKKGKSKYMKSNSGRMRLNINGVYSPIDNEIIVRDDKTINAESNIKLLEKIEKLHPELNRIIVYGDMAPYNRSKVFKEYLNKSKIDFRYLPKYSPNLNLIERLWKLMKKKVMYNKYYADFNDFKKAILKFFKECNKRYRSEIKSLLVENFHLFSSG
jgi:transposase